MHLESPQVKRIINEVATVYKFLCVKSIQLD